MWAQTWGNIYDIVTPFPGKSGPDVSKELIRQVNESRSGRRNLYLTWFFYIYIKKNTEAFSVAFNVRKILPNVANFYTGDRKYLSVFL